MTAEALRFNPKIQGALDAGAITALDGWRLLWEFEMRLNEPWDLHALAAHRLVVLHDMDMSGARAQ
jgi:hypothetical protein